MALYIIHMPLQFGVCLDRAKISIVAHRNIEIEDVGDKVRRGSYSDFVNYFVTEAD